MKNTKSARDEAMAAIKKKFGSTVGPADMSEDIIPDVIPTGSFQLDMKTGIGGYPRGRILEFYGLNQSGKTTLTLITIAEAQKLGHRCAFIDAEQGLNKAYAESLGVDLSMMDHSQPNTGEEALEILEILAETGEYAIIVVDSVAALVPAKEVEGDMGASHVGLQARLMGQGLRKLAPKVRESNTLVIFLNQIRMKVGVMFGNPETTSGGMSLPFYSSMRFSIRAGSKADEVKDPITGEVAGGWRTVTVVKNRFAGTAKHKVKFILYHDSVLGSGIDRNREVFDAAIDAGLIDKEGNTYLYEGEKLGVGLQKAFDGMSASAYHGLEKELIQISRLKDPVKARMLKALEDG